MATTAFAIRDLNPKDNAHAGRTIKINPVILTELISKKHILEFYPKKKIRFARIFIQVL
jgi:hypothetical protein